MWKKLLAILLVLLAVFSISKVGYTASVNNKSRYQVITPEKDYSATKKKTVLISGKAPQGTEIIIEVYNAIDLTGKNYSLTRLPKDEDYVLVSSKTIKSGAAGFGEEIELILGVNKIVVKFNVNGIPSVEKIFYYYEVERAVEALKNPSILYSTN